jgi:hypothetical protein
VGPRSEKRLLIREAPERRVRVWMLEDVERLIGAGRKLEVRARTRV